MNVKFYASVKFVTLQEQHANSTQALMSDLNKNVSNAERVSSFS